MHTGHAASDHWIALDRIVRRLVGDGSPMAHERAPLAQRAAALSQIYVRRLVRLTMHETRNRRDLRRQLLRLQRTHRELTRALARWPDDGSPARTKG